MEFPPDLLYSTDHEWVRSEVELATVGVTDFAQDALGEVVFINLPEVGQVVEAKQAVGEIESTKSVSDFYAPVSGTIVAVNEVLNSEPGKVNSDPYGVGWLYQLSKSNESELLELLNTSQYQETVEGN